MTKGNRAPSSRPEGNGPRDLPRYRSVACPICGEVGAASEVYPARLPPEGIDPALFSARRPPDGLHHRIVRCSTCGLLRSDPVLTPEVLAHLYAASGVHYQVQIPDLVHTYGRQLRRLIRLGAQTASLLEVGCGNGFFLAEARRVGFTDARGVEPGRAAVAEAAPSVMQHITVDVMRPGLYPPASFDVVCLFQVFDHLPDPRAVLQACREVLRPGGYILLFNHNAAAFSARILGERSPIVDIEHTFLFTPRTMARIMVSEQFQVVSVRAVSNRCRLDHLRQLLPPGHFRDSLVGPLVHRLRLGGLRITLPVGNLCAVGRRPTVELPL